MVKKRTSSILSTWYKLLGFLFNILMWCIIVTVLVIKLWEFKCMWIFEIIQISEPNKIILAWEIFIVFICLVWVIKKGINYFLKIIEITETFK